MNSLGYKKDRRNKVYFPGDDREIYYSTIYEISDDHVKRRRSYCCFNFFFKLAICGGGT